MRLNFFLLLIIILISCQEPHTNKTISASKKITDTTSKNIISEFEKFYVRFNEDSSFRIERTVFPLKGFNGTREDWTPFNYRFPHVDISKIDTTREWYTYRIIKDSIITEGFGEMRSGDFSRRFVRIKGRWYLDSCAIHTY